MHERAWCSCLPLLFRRCRIFVSSKSLHCVIAHYICWPTHVPPVLARPNRHLIELGLAYPLLKITLLDIAKILLAPFWYAFLITMHPRCNIFLLPITPCLLGKFQKTFIGQPHSLKLEVAFFLNFPNFSKLSRIRLWSLLITSKWVIDGSGYMSLQLQSTKALSNLSRIKYWVYQWFDQVYETIWPSVWWTWITQVNQTTINDKILEFLEFVLGEGEDTFFFTIEIYSQWKGCHYIIPYEGSIIPLHYIPMGRVIISLHCTPKGKAVIPLIIPQMGGSSYHCLYPQIGGSLYHCLFHKKEGHHTIVYTSNRRAIIPLFIP